MENDLKIIIEALIKASNSTETEWLKIEKLMLDIHSSNQNGNTNNSVYEMWNQLYIKVKNSMDRMKNE